MGLSVLGIIGPMVITIFSMVFGVIKSLNIFTTLEDVNQFFVKTYDRYAKANLSDAHIQNNYQTMLKIFPHKDSTQQNPKIDWSSIQWIVNN